MNDSRHIAGHAFNGCLSAVAGVGVLASLIAASSPAQAIECPDGLGVYRGTTTTTHELRFASEAGGTIVLSKGRTRAVYPFTLTHSNGLARTYITVSGKDAPNSLMMEFGPDFTPSKVRGAAPFLVTPELTSGFYYWSEFRAKDQNDLLPDSAWRRVGCTLTTPTKGGARP